MSPARRAELVARWQVAEAELRRLHDLAVRPEGSPDVKATEDRLHAELDAIEGELGEAYLAEQRAQREQR